MFLSFSVIHSHWQIIDHFKLHKVFLQNVYSSMIDIGVVWHLIKAGQIRGQGNTMALLLPHLRARMTVRSPALVRTGSDLIGDVPELSEVTAPHPCRVTARCLNTSEALQCQISGPKMIIVTRLVYQPALVIITRMLLDKSSQ